MLDRKHACGGYSPLEGGNVDRVPLCPPDYHHQSEGPVSLHGLGMFRSSWGDPHTRALKGNP